MKRGRKLESPSPCCLLKPWRDAKSWRSSVHAFCEDKMPKVEAWVMPKSSVQRVRILSVGHDSCPFSYSHLAIFALSVRSHRQYDNTIILSLMMMMMMWSMFSTILRPLCGFPPLHCAKNKKSPCQDCSSPSGMSQTNAPLFSLFFWGCPSS